MKRICYFLILSAVLTMMVPSRVWGQEITQVVPADTFSTPHFRIMYERGISFENIRMVADEIELIYGDFNAKVLFHIPKKIPVVLAASIEGLMYKYSGMVESPIFFSRDTLYIVSWIDRKVPRDRVLPILRYFISYTILYKGSAHGTPHWLIYGYALRYANFGFPLTPPPVAYMRSFNDFCEEEQQFYKPGESGKNNYLLLKTINFLIDRYGEEKFVSLFKVISIDRTMEEGFEKVFGEKYIVIEKAWRTYIDTQVGKSTMRKENEPQQQEK
jgi:hypothetical protein